MHFCVLSSIKTSEPVSEGTTQAQATITLIGVNIGLIGFVSHLCTLPLLSSLTGERFRIFMHRDVFFEW